MYVAIYRSQKKARTGLRSLDRAVEDGEEGIREDDENGEGETHRRLQPALLLAGGRRLGDGDGERRRLCGRTPGRARAAPAWCVRPLSAGRGGLGQGMGI